MYLDINQNNVSNLVSDMSNAVYEKERIDLVSTLGAKFMQEGNQYCWIYGELPNNAIIGFGDTPGEAMHDFWKSFYNQKPNKMVEQIATKEQPIEDNYNFFIKNLYKLRNWLLKN